MRDLFSVEKPIIGMVHLRPLPGSPLYEGGGLEPIVEQAVKDAKALEEGGVDGIQIENFGDRLFKKNVGPETVAFVTEIVHRIKEEISLPHGLCILMSGRAGLAIAKATGGKWVRVPYYMEVYASYVGLMEGEAAELLRFRRYIDARDVKIFADIHIKHAYPLLQRSIEDAASDAVEMGLADAVIVTGKATGSPTNPEDVKAVKERLAGTQVPVLIGSGVSVENIEKYWPYIDGIIVGTSLKVDGVTTNPVDVERVKRFMSKVRRLRER